MERNTVERVPLIVSLLLWNSSIMDGKTAKLML